MKRSIILITVAALALVGCTKVQDVYTGAPESHEIAFQAIATPTTRAAVDGEVFPTTVAMKVTAYDATAPKVYFDATTFNHSGSSNIWSGSTAKYWPLTPATINFLAIANANADNETGVTWGTNKADQVTIVMSDNSTAQHDLMYACGTGTVSQSGNVLTFPTNVPMQFKHAQAWVKFYVKGGDAASASAITINSIKLNSVSCNGTYLVTHANWNETAATRAEAAPAGSKDGSVSGVWSAYTPASDINAVKEEAYTALSAESQYYGSLMVVPAQGIASFTINYTVGGNTYDYTYTPASTTLAQATKYTYNITLTVHEIVIAATVDDWDPYDFDGSTEGQQDQAVNVG